MNQVVEGGKSIRSWVRPLLNILFPGCKDNIECDVISLGLLEDDAKLHILECTTQKSMKKSMDDYDKMKGKVTKFVSERFSDLKIALNQYKIADVKNILLPIESLFKE